MGHIDPSCRLPLVLPQPENQAKVEKVLQELGLLAGKEKEYVAGREN
jgi:dihydrodipicolinate synthase/N-acetylneuraminate lyase